MFSACQGINAVADGAHPMPSGWHGGAFNDSGTPQTLEAAAIRIPASQVANGATLVGTAVQASGTRLGANSCGIRTLALGAGMSEYGPSIGQIQAFAPRLPSLPRFANSRPDGVYESFDAFLYSWHGPSSDPVPGRCATVCVEPTAAPNYAVTAVEYFNARFGHYFATPMASEIAALDQGVFAGWPRTGQSFRVLSEGTLSTAPVCRQFREDVTSHFYSASVAECAAVRTFSGWFCETGRMFSGAMPDDLTARTSKTGLVPLYRLWYTVGQTTVTRRASACRHRCRATGHEGVSHRISPEFSSRTRRPTQRGDGSWSVWCCPVRSPPKRGSRANLVLPISGRPSSSRCAASCRRRHSPASRVRCSARWMRKPGRSCCERSPADSKVRLARWP